jgi:hypothetical protein
LISFRKLVDITDLPKIFKLQKASNIVLKHFLRNVFLCLGGIALTACQSDPANTTNNESDPQQENPVRSDSQVADLTDDSLLSPTVATLSITSEPGFLNLTWEAIPDQQKANIYKFDGVEEFEVLIAQINDNTKQTIKLPSRTHQRAWQSEQFRVELCNTNDCLSSARVSITELVEGSVQRVYPSVFVRSEKFADNVAFNTSASLMAVSLPVQGVIDLYLRSENLWFNTQRIALESNTLPSTRTITLGLSPSGDTMSALVADGKSNLELKIIERFGEAWFETTSLELDRTTKASASNLEVRTSDTLSISKDSNLILISTRNELFTTTRTRTGWTALSLLQQEQYQPSHPAFTKRFTTEAVLKTASANHTHTRLFTVHSLDQSLWLSVWEQTTADSATPTWNKTSAYEINNINSMKDVSIHSNSSGDRLVLAGWELNNDVERTPVLWRYQIPTVSALNATRNSELSVIDSLRFPFAAQSSAVLRFSADDSLNHVVLGWQSMLTATSAPDAALITYQFSATAMRWLPKLELPEVFPTFAKQSFVRSALLSPDGDTMTISIGAGQSLADENQVGELVTLQ